MAAGGKAINLGELAIAIALKTGALEAGLKDVQNKLKDHGKKVQATGADYDKLAIVAGVAFWKITSAISGGVKAFNDFNNSMVGLKSIVQGTGGDFQQAQKFIDGFIADGLVPANNAAMALKNLLSRGFGMDQAADMLNRLKDSAAFARQGSLTMGEAIQGATEGLKNENSVLVDNAGVTKNVSVMWKEYAATIGKGADSLTQAEKVIAEYNGIMKETQFQVGDAAKYSEQFAGAQARNTAETLKLKQAFGGALVPALNTLLSITTPIISAFANFVKGNPELVAAITLAATAFLGIITIITGVRAAITLLGPALATLNKSLGALMINPVVLAITALAVVGGVVASQIMKAKKAQDEYNSAIEKFNKIKTQGIQKAEIPQVQEQVDQLKSLTEQYDKLTSKYKEIKSELNASAPAWKVLKDAEEETGISSSKLADDFNKLGIKINLFSGNADEAKKKTKELEAEIKAASRTTLTEFSDQAKVIAQKKVAVTETQNLINAYKSAEKGTKDWYDARDKLAEQFPQFSTAAGIEIKAIESTTNAQESAIKAEWQMLQAKVAMAKIDLLTIMEIKTATLERLQVEQDLNDYLAAGIGKKVERPFGIDTLAVRKAKAELEDLKKEMGDLDAFKGINIEDILGIKPIKTDFTPYENAALDSAMKIHDHKVAMEELSKEQELADLQKILKAYAKSADERMSLEEKIFRVKQEIRDRDLAATQKAIDDEAKKLADRTANSENWIEREKAAGNLTGQEEVDAYNRVIKYHKEYLAKINANTKMSQDEKKKIIADETKYIQDQQNKIFEIQKSNVEKAINSYIEAKKKQYDTEEQLENDRLNEKLKALDKEYADRERALKSANRSAELSSLYEQEKRYANAATKEGQDKLADIRRQIADLQAEAVQDSMDAEKEARQAAIEQEIEDNKNKYKKLNDDLDTEGKALIAASATYAKQANDEIVKGQNTIANSLKTIMTNFDKDSASLITKGMENLKKLIEGYKKIMDGITMSPMSYLPQSTKPGTALSKQNQGITVNVTDNGAKYINSKDEAIDYTKELFNSAENAARQWGGAIG